MDDKSIWMLTEREKELECMYAVDDVLQNKQLSLPVAMNQVVQILPSGFSYPSSCHVKIVLFDIHFLLPNFNTGTYLYQTPILMNGESVGSIEVRYFVEKDGVLPELLKSEIKIVKAVAARISQLALTSQRENILILDLLQNVDPLILARVCQQLQVYVSNLEGDAPKPLPTMFVHGEVNTPLPKQVVPDRLEYGQRLVSRAAAFQSSTEIYELINHWIGEERLFSLVKTVGNRDAEISEILDAVRKYTKLVTSTGQASPTEKWLLAELAHRFLTTDEQLIDHVMDYLVIADFEPLLSRIIGTSKTEGGIGGKGAGLFIAEQILKHAAKTDPILADIKTPHTWYLAADQMDVFLKYNQMEEMYAYKYHSISYFRMTYDDIVAKIKNGKFPSQIMQMLVMVLDDMQDVPLIVRSSSLLEDRSNSAFSGKYKSLYLSNQGTKAERLNALVDAILEVYSSQYNPDSFQYREQRHLLHFSEKMGILIQEVVGTNIGPYYMPLFAGVAFSENPLCWSPRITREGGLVRMVMGLGTRAVDRVNNDYPLLCSPQNPGFRINQTPEDVLHYSPRFIDLMNLERGCFETVAAEPFLKEWGKQMPQLHKLVSVYHSEYIQKKNAMELSPQKDPMVITFEGILMDTDFTQKINRMFAVLTETMGIQVDLEFAYDGEHLVLLQCRSLNKGIRSEAPPIPHNIPKQDVIFTANRFISNGLIEQIRYLVYVDGDAYRQLSSRGDLLAVGEAVGKLNVCLPRREFILMGPGRWGSRGDIQLGVRVTYADICNTALLIEIAKKQQTYIPELSFGTHFFQDLVESNIAYLPLYPDQGETIFKEQFLKSQPHQLAKLLPQYQALSEVLYVIDLAADDTGETLSVYMNAKLNQAIAFLSDH